MDKQIIGLVSEGVGPSVISKRLGLSFGSVAQAIRAAVDAGQLQRSQVQATLDESWLQLIGAMAKNPRISAEQMPNTLRAIYPDCDLDIEGVKFYLAYSGKEFRAGETYELLSEIERTLHKQIERILKQKYGEEEADWWRRGVPENVRQDCVKLRESDSEFSGDPPYAYTTLIHLKSIIDKEWPLFEKRLPEPVVKSKQGKQGIMDDLRKLNGVRNRVMHPVRGAPPTEEDLKFVKRMQEALQLSKWRKRTGGKS